MEAENVKLILAHLDKLAEKLGIGAAHIWPWFVRQVYIQWCFLFGMGVIVSLLSWICFSIALKTYILPDGAKILSDLPPRQQREIEAWRILGFAAGTIFAFLAFFFLCAASLDILNPEYHAFMRLLKSIKP